MSVVIEARDEMVEQLLNLKAGSEEMLRQAQAIKIMSEINRDDEKLEFEREKEDTRNMEKSDEFVYYSETEMQLKKIDLAIKAIDVILNPGSRLFGIFMNNRTRVRRDVMGYNFETTGVIGSHTLNNAQKDKYD
jgi:hypothetical protein